MHNIMSQVGCWIEDKEFSKNAFRYLQTLYNEVSLMRSVSGGNKLWVDLLKEGNCIPEFLSTVIKYDNYDDPKEFRFIYCYMNHLIELTDQAVFPMRESIVRWLDRKKRANPLSPLLNPYTIKDRIQKAMP